VSTLTPRRAARVIVLVVAAAYLLFFQTTFLVPDSSGTYAWARSLLFDADVDFADEFERLGFISGDERIRFHPLLATGRPGNPFGMGSGLLWMPFLVTTEAVLWLAGAASEPGGYSELHVLAASTGTVLFAVAALLLIDRICRRFVGARASLGAVMGVAFGTPLFAYVFHLPTYAHANAAFATTLALWGALRARESAGAGPWVLAGATAGLAALVRAQNLFLLAIPLALWAATARGDRKGSLTKLGALAGGFGLLFAPQVVAWWRIYGVPWEIPQGGGFLDLARPHLVSVLFSPWHGLLSWSPILLLSALGAGLLFRRDRALAIGAVTTVVLQAWLVASVPDWWGGYAMGARRFVDLTPLFALWMALALAWLAQRRGRALPAALLAAGILWNQLLTLQVRVGFLSPFREVTYGEIIVGQARALWHLPRYLWALTTRSWGAIHLVVHRDSPVQPTLDPVPGWTLLLGLLACWALGLAVLAAVERWPAGRARG
jgi:hypothetical protein